ncbi:SITS-binding protein-like [Coturnix japonica]|uniref:SITS-binding protein-like n=1 Tax=Coturnix japonica TaxID=93934 RepID=UPI0007773754|nr:SITS-binding protein-like [Coturnix japonica]XP_015718924.1 SITS-binding protein-like [Coturnix japonica]XP_015718926.1 SITS-binding protein-like [Coturnix japonica]
MPIARPTGRIPEAAWTSGIRELTEPWKGALGCLGVAVFFAMTIGIISWQALEQPLEEWMLRGQTSGMLWDRRRGALLLRALPMGRPLVSITVGSVPASEPPLPRDRCWQDSTEFCYTWEEEAELRISIQPTPAPGTECYSVHWTPLRPDITMKDCFSMANVSWYGGASLRAQHWPFNSAESPEQPFVSGDFSKNPTGYGPVLERYFLGSTGVTVTVAPDVPLVLSLESHWHFCLGGAGGPLHYVLCFSPDITTAHRHVGTQLAGPARALPDTTLLWSPIWQYDGPEGSAAKIKRGLRSLAKRLKRHRMQEGVLALREHGTATLATTDHVPAERRKRHGASHAWDPAMIFPLQLSITLSPYISIAAPLFLHLLRDGETGYWLSLQPRYGGCSVPLLTTWKGQLCARLNITNEAALSWYLSHARGLRHKLGAKYVIFEGAEGNAFLEQAMSPPAELAGDQYAEMLAAALVTLGNATVISVGARSSHLPFFVQMSPLHSDWSYAGLKGLIPSTLHYSLLGYNFFIPDTVGGSLAGDTPGDQELYVRWLQIVTFLPVMAFGTPPWLCCDSWVLNLTRQCIQKHRDFVVPLIIKYSKEWLSSGYPIFRPAWWLSPTDPTAFTVEDEFLIGDEVLVAPITEKGQTWRDIYLPGEGCRWRDTNSARVFDGGTVIRNYSVSLEEVPVFLKIS